MPTKTWSIKWHGHSIEVENWWAIGLIFNRHRSRLFIDGKCEDELAGKGFFLAGQGSLKTILRSHIPDEKQQQLPIKVELTARLFTINCSVFVDEECILNVK